MKRSLLEKYLKIAQEVSGMASKYLLDNFGDIKKTTSKVGTHYTIKEDVVCNDLYEEFLRKNTPEVALYTEEGEKKLNSGLVWVVDPIEGTSNFKAGIPFFATQICLLENYIPVVSVIRAPVLKQNFLAIKGGGVLLNGKTVCVSKTNKLESALLSFGKGPNQEALIKYSKFTPKVSKKVRTIRHFGSTGLELAYVASAKIDLHVNMDSKIYDYLPGTLLVKEGGGTLLNSLGKEWTIKDKVLFTGNSKLTKKIYDVLY